MAYNYTPIPPYSPYGNTDYAGGAYNTGTVTPSWGTIDVATPSVAAPTVTAPQIQTYTGAGSSYSGAVAPVVPAAVGAQNPVGSYLGGKQINSSGAYGTPPAVAGAAGAGAEDSLQLGANIGTAKLALGGLQTIGNLWNAWQAQQLAKKQFEYTKQITDQNITNQIQSYNTTLNDRIRARSATEGRDDAYTQAYIDKNELHRTY